MTRLVLNRPHTHAGQAYTAGDRIEVEATTAEWLLSHGIAEALPIAEPLAPKTDPEPNSQPRKEPKR